MNTLPKDYQYKPNALYIEKVEKHKAVDWSLIKQFIRGELELSEVVEKQARRIAQQVGVSMLLSAFNELS